MYDTYIYKLLRQKLNTLKSATKVLLLKGNKNHSSVKLYESMKRCMFEIANDPGSKDYFLGNTMGTEHRDWRRSKKFLPDRHRLFF